MSEQERQQLSTSDLASAGQRDVAEPEREVAEPDREHEPRDQPRPAPTAVREDSGAQSAALFPAEEAQSLRTHWDDVQAGFVDDPRQAVQQADSLVAEVIKRLADSFAEERSRLEGQWSRGENVSTEDLRVALRRYRSFFDRLLSI
jgi:hypothetical protein